ncbi:hypothetical protein [Nannocystis punicea]|uniref:Uncharacterized protein n=1 Tax=Nannocystis punicea TaxID=2995304 RepID=A0ABY7H4U6_9BACT|nr:hypothetical protein [Nannocystis poenicansa]WAS94311.1 hypothetical protein O0S08_49955 [Nannocystis poenicansa]
MRAMERVRYEIVFYYGWRTVVPDAVRDCLPMIRLMNIRIMERCLGAEGIPEDLIDLDLVLLCCTYLMSLARCALSRPG